MAPERELVEECRRDPGVDEYTAFKPPPGQLLEAALHFWWELSNHQRVPILFINSMWHLPVLTILFIANIFFIPFTFYVFNNFNKLFQKQLSRTKNWQIFLKGKMFGQVPLIEYVWTELCQLLIPNFIFLEKKENAFSLRIFAFV